MTLVDARGVEISPGDTAIYGFGVGRSVAMAEAVVLGDEDHYEIAMMRDGFGVGPAECSCGASRPCPPRVSLTPSGRVRLRVVRRSYSSGEKPVVDVAPDRLVVLKAYENFRGDMMPTLLPSPLPTQAEANRQRIENLMEAYTADLRATEVPDRHYCEGWTLERFHAYAAEHLAELRKDLKALDGEG